MTYSGRKGGGGKRNNNYGYHNRGSYYGNNNQHENSNSRNHGNNNSNNNSNNHRNNWGQSNNWNQARSTPFHQNRSAHGIRNHHEDVNDNPQYMRPGDRNNNPPTNGNNENSQIDNTRSQNDNRDSRNQGRNQESSRRVKGVNKDTWDQFSLQDRIQSQYQGNFNDYYHKDQIFEDSDEWAEKKELAAEYAVEKLMTEMIEDAAKTQNTNQDIYESDSEDSYMQDTVPITAGGAATANTANLAYPRSTIEKFIDSLRFNLIFNVGFDVKGIHPDDEVSCFCPCSKTMSDWRDNFKVNHMESKDKCNYYRRAEPKGLMDHLRKTGEQGGFLHRGIELYVTKLYEGYWGRDIGHKALYNKGDDMHKKAEAEERRWKMIEYMSIKRDLDETRKKIKEQEEELKKEKEAVHNLKAVNQKLGEKYTAQKKNFEVLDIEMNPHTDAPTQQQIDKWCRVSRTHFESLKKIIKFRDPNVETRFEREMIVIKLPHHFILQNFFDKVHKESAPKQSTFLFRDLTYQTKKFAPEGYFSYKLFLDWNVIFDAPIKSKRGHRIKMEDEDDKIQGKDEGGPTSQFISMFCMQLCDLSVMLPFDSDVKNTNIDISREELKQETDFINPEKGSKVLYKGKYATVINHSTDYCNADLEIDADGEQIFNVERRAFIVEKIPIKLFEQTSGGIVPERDDIFDNALIKYRSQKFDPKLDQAQLEARGRKYYRAVGRFLLHVMADGRNPIPTTVMPEFYRNVLLRGCMPGSDEYADADFYTHLAQIEGFKDVRVFFNQEFELYGIEKEGIITKENFKTDFAPAYIVDARSKNLEALREGLTLNGEFPLDILSCQPLEAINQTFFSKPTFSVQDIIVLLKPCYENEILDEVSRDNHELFMKQTLPQALEALEKIEKESKKDSSFLADFLFFATGTRCVPYCNGMPDFNLSILFAHIPDDSLPATHTCENLIHIPWGVYDNNAEIFMTKLQTAVKYALVAGFDRM